MNTKIEVGDLVELVNNVEVGIWSRMLNNGDKGIVTRIFITQYSNNLINVSWFTSNLEHLNATKWNINRFKLIKKNYVTVDTLAILDI